MSYFRPMQANDLEVVFGIELKANKFPGTFKQIQDAFLLSSLQDSSVSASYQCWVCCLDDTAEIVAYALISSVLDESDLQNLCVSIEYQGQGYGRKFLEYLMNNARKEGQARLFLEVRASNKKAIQLYESALFKQVSIRKGYYPSIDTREDALIYSLSLH